MRRLMYNWLLPAAVVLPAWLFFGWLIFSRDGWALLPTLLIFLPSVFLGQLVLALLVRSRASVRTSHMVSWADVAAFGIWHALIILVGWFASPVFGLTLAAAIVAALATFWLAISELWKESRTSWTSYVDPTSRAYDRLRTDQSSAAPTIVVSESAVTEPAPKFGQH